MILLTGATGTIGTPLVRRLTAAGEPVRCLVRDPRRLATPGGLVPFLLVTAALGALILLEPDMGTAVVLCAGAVAMLIVAGARLRHLGSVVAIGGFLAVVAVMAEHYRRERLLAFIDPWSDPNGAGFQSVQAQVARNPRTSTPGER